MDFALTQELAGELKKLKHKQPLLFNKVRKQLKTFKENVKHPSLRTHKLRGNLSNTWSISIEGNIRLVYVIKNKEALFFKLGNHDEVYRK